MHIKAKINVTVQEAIHCSGNVPTGHVVNCTHMCTHNQPLAYDTLTIFSEYYTKPRKQTHINFSSAFLCFWKFITFYVISLPFLYIQLLPPSNFTALWARLLCLVVTLAVHRQLLFLSTEFSASHVGTLHMFFVCVWFPLLLRHSF